MVIGLEMVKRALLTDFCPNQNRRAPWRHPLGVLVMVVLTSLLCTFAVGGRSLVVAGSMLAITALGVLWPALTLWGVRGAVSFDRARSVEGSATPVRVRLTNYWPLPVSGLAIDLGGRRTTPAADETPADLTLPMMWGWRSIELICDFRPARRGAYPLMPPTVRCGFPFGLWTAKRRLSVHRPLLVWPGSTPIRELSDSGARQFQGENLQDKAGASGEITGVREYRRGDALQRVHWRQTAKHGRLIVCEQQSPCSPWVQIVLDVQSACHVIDPWDSREHAIRLAASFAQSAWRRGTGVELITAGQVVTDVHTAILDALARVPDRVDATLSDLLTLADRSASSQVSRLVITTDQADWATVRSSRVMPRWVVLETGPAPTDVSMPRIWWRIGSPTNPVREATNAIVN